MVAATYTKNSVLIILNGVKNTVYMYLLSLPSHLANTELYSSFAY